MVIGASFLSQAVVVEARGLRDMAGILINKKPILNHLKKNC